MNRHINVHKKNELRASIIRREVSSNSKLANVAIELEEISDFDVKMEEIEEGSTDISFVEQFRIWDRL